MSTLENVSTGVNGVSESLMDAQPYLLTNIQSTVAICHSFVTETTVDEVEALVLLRLLPTDVSISKLNLWFDVESSLDHLSLRSVA
jgi:hypothetical protein